MKIFKFAAHGVRSVAVMSAITCLCLLLASCSSFLYTDEPYGGSELSSDDLESIYLNISGDDSSERQTAEIEPLPDQGATGLTVYWAEGGGVYHTDENCPHYKNATDKTSGPLDIAIKSGKKRLCSNCGEQENGSQPQNTSEGESIYDIP